MSEESNVIALSTEKGKSLEDEIMKDNASKPVLHSSESPSTEKADIPVENEQAQAIQKPIEPVQPEQSEPVHGYLMSNEKATDSSPSEGRLPASTETKFLERIADGNLPASKPTSSDGYTDAKPLEKASDDGPSWKSTTSDGSTNDKSSKSASGNESSVKSTTSDGSTDTKSLERESCNQPSVKPTTSDGSTGTKSLERASGNEPSVKSTTSDESTNTKSLEKASDVDQPGAKSTSTDISPSEVPSADKGLEKVTENIQLIYEGLKGMKISTEEIPVPASGKKGRKPPTTPRARSTPVLTSPPLTRSRSRDLRKVPSTPSSPKRSASRNTSEGDSDEMKVRGRQRAKKN